MEDVFYAQLPQRRAERSRLVDALVVATDVYTWKLLRRDRGLDVDDVHDRMLPMAQPILSATGAPLKILFAIAAARKRRPMPQRIRLRLGNFAEAVSRGFKTHQPARR